MLLLDCLERETISVGNTAAKLESDAMARLGISKTINGIKCFICSYFSSG